MDKWQEVDSWEKYRLVDETLHRIVYSGIAQCSDYFLELHLYVLTPATPVGDFLDSLLMPIAAVYIGAVLPVSLLCSATIITSSLLPSSVL